MTPDEIRKYEIAKRFREDGGPGSGPRPGKGKYAKLAQEASDKAEKSGNGRDHQFAAMSHRMAAADETDPKVSEYHISKAEHHGKFV